MPALTVDNPSGSSSLRDDALTIALALVLDRIQSLPQEDKNDLLELLMELPKAQTEEELQSLQVALREILAQKPVRVRRMDLAGTENEPGLQRWKQDVSEKIRSLRTQAGMTQHDLAVKSGLPQSHISRLETGTHSPSRATLEKIAHALGQPLSALDPSA